MTGALQDGLAVIAFGPGLVLFGMQLASGVFGPDPTSEPIIAVVAVAVLALVGAVLGGLAAMRSHREVDRAGLGG